MRILFIIIVFFSSLLAMEFERKYEGRITLFGVVGSGIIKERRMQDCYSITFSAKPTKGMRTLSGYKSVTYVSKGKITKEGKLIPDFFQETKIQKHKKTDTIYIFNHEKKTVLKQKHIEKHIKKHLFNFWINAKKYNHIEITDKNTTVEYAQNDYLTLIQNVRFFPLGELHYVGQKKRAHVILEYAKKNLFRFRTKTKTSHYFVEMRCDKYGLKDANTYKSFKLGKAYIQTVATHMIKE